jgi:hypothetical protein
VITKRWCHGFGIPVIFLTVVMLYGGVELRADVIDRMMAVVDDRVVTLSDLGRYRDIARLFGDPVPESDSAILELVIENMLIQGQLEQLGVRVSEQEVAAAIEQVGDHGDLPPDVIRAATRERLRRARYFNRRFAPGASDAEIADYYQSVFVPAAAAEGLDPIPPLEDVREAIRTNVITEKMDEEISVWVESLRRRSEVEVVE